MMNSKTLHMKPTSAGRLLFCSREGRGERWFPRMFAPHGQDIARAPLDNA